MWASSEYRGFTWNEGSYTNITNSTASKNPSLDYIHRKEFSVSLRGSFFNRLITTDLTFFNTDLDGYIIQNPTVFPSHLQSGLNGGSFKPTINNNIQNRRGLDFSISAQKQLGKVYAQLGVVGTYLTTNYKQCDELLAENEQHLNKEGRPLDVIWATSAWASTQKMTSSTMPT